MTSTSSTRGITKTPQSPLPSSVLGARTNMMDEPLSTKNQTEEEKNIDASRVQLIINTTTKFDFNDIVLVPMVQSTIESRYGMEINPFHNDKLPLFTAPMDTVVNSSTYQNYLFNNINVVFPRTEKLKNSKEGFNSFGFDELKDIIPNMSPIDGTCYILIDVANGHMNKIIRYAKMMKERNPNVVIMAGNIANPETYKVYCDSGVIDYARIGIGNGNGCLTTKQTGIGYPMASLIAECHEIKKSHIKKVNIVADGGMKDFSDIIKALALGADYVMVGSIFNKALESASKSYWKGIPIGKKLAQRLYAWGFEIKKDFRGMSTKQSQKLMGNKKLRTSEGVIRKQRVEYTLAQWTDNFESYLRTAMSYSNSKNLNEFIGKVRYTTVTQNSYLRFNK